MEVFHPSRSWEVILGRFPQIEKQVEIHAKQN